MIKRLLVILLLAASFSGCTIVKEAYSDFINSQTNSLFSSFNDKNYVWENFNTTTNQAKDFN